MSRRCENCASWGHHDSVWGECFRAESEDARMAVHEDERGYCNALETKFDFGCVEWSSNSPKAIKSEPFDNPPEGSRSA